MRQSKQTKNLNLASSLSKSSRFTGMTIKQSLDNVGDELENFIRSKQLLKPDDQLELSQDDLKDEHPRILVTKGMQTVQNLVEYSYKERCFVPLPKPANIIEKFSLDGYRLHIESPEAIHQKLYEVGQPPAGSVPKKTIRSSTDSTEDMDDSKPDDVAEEPVPEVVEEPPPPAEPVAEEESEKEMVEGEEEEEKAPVKEDSAPQILNFAPKKVVNEFNFCQREAMTYNNPFRNMQNQTITPCRLTFFGQITQWDIFDGYMEDQRELARIKEAEADAKFKDHKKDEHKVEDKHLKEKLQHEIDLRTEQAAKTIERMINQNTYDDIAQDYRYWNDPADDYQEEGSLLPLWKFVYEKNKRLTITGICWNPCYYDYFAVIFGTFEFSKPVTEGSLCLFSLKNPSFPTFIANVDSGVMSIDIHPQHPDLVVLGLYDGNVAVFNVQISNKPQFRSDSKTGKHGSIVWQVKWVKDTADDEINFYTLAGDGDVCNWVLMKAEMVRTTVMILKIVAPPVSGPYGTLINRSRCGSYIVFHPKDPLVYLAGTEEGAIHKNSTMYNSIALKIYNAHTLPVHKIDYNKFYPDIFISCSADWRITIWEDNRDAPIFMFDVGASVGDVEWAPFSSTIFAACTIDGRVHIFDLHIDKYRPICVQNIVSKKRNKLTTLAFNSKLPFLIVGDDKGCVTSLKLSPNLRKKVKPPKKGPKYTPDELEVLKLEKILASVREPVILSAPDDVGKAPY